MLNFNGKENDNKDIGVIAQEVEKVYPDLVKTTNLNHKSVDYGKLTAVLIESIKELKNENTTLKNNLDELQSKVDEISTKLDGLTSI